jgi:hypothetical protein
MILTPQEIVDLTLKERPSAQARELAHLGVPCRPRTDGSLVVLWDDVRTHTQTSPRTREPQLRLA